MDLCRYDVLETATDFYVVTEYVPGGELFDYIVNKGRVRSPFHNFGGEIRSRAIIR